MKDSPDVERLQARVAELERELAALRRGRPRGYRYRSATTLLGLPLVSIAVGPDFEAGERRGHARGIIAIGDIASGFLAIGGVACGLIAIGGVAIGGLALGGVALGLVAALGGAAIGGWAFGGAALGGVAFGGAAIGYYAVGGGVVGAHTIGPMGVDPVCLNFLRSLIGLPPVGG